MEKASKGVAWICMLITLFAGCYSSAGVIGPDSPDKERMFSDRILFVETKDGKGYEFDSPPDIRDSSLVGYVMGEYTLIPLSDVDRVKVERLDGVATSFAIAGCIGFLYLCVVVTVGEYKQWHWPWL
jgi:hypothetical protein